MLEMMKSHGTKGMTIAVLGGGGRDAGFNVSADVGLGLALAGAEPSQTAPMTPETWVEVASLSKTIAAAFLLEWCARNGMSADTPANEALAKASSSFRIEAAEGCPKEWADQVLLRHLVDHTGLGMHYVKGIPREREMPQALDIIEGRHREDLGYERITVAKEPGTRFGYSGGGFLVLQHLLEAFEGKPIEEVMRPFLDSCGMRNFTFRQDDVAGASYARGYFDNGEMVPGGRLMFPPLAAGGLGTVRSLANFWRQLVDAYHTPGLQSSAGGAAISHATAVAMLDSAADKGSGAFMNAAMGMGVFVVPAGPNKVAVHQAANEGFRGIYLVVFSGPDEGKGYIVIANGDNQSALCIAKVVQHLLLKSEWAGVDMDLLRSRTDYDFTGVKQEEIVNFAYKTLVFDAFMLQDSRERLKTLVFDVDKNQTPKHAEEAPGIKSLLPEA